jgi:hypothetical protein
MNRAEALEHVKNVFHQIHQVDISPIVTDFDDRMKSIYEKSPITMFTHAETFQLIEFEIRMYQIFREILASLNTPEKQAAFIAFVKNRPENSINYEWLITPQEAPSGPNTEEIS